MNAKNSPFSNKPLLFGVISTLVVLGSVLSYLGTQSGFGSLLSQFSGANVTHMNAAQLWQPSTTNPHRTAITTYSTRLDAVVKNILGRGTSLTATEFANYLNSLSTGINSLAKSPKYVRDTEVQKISAYLEYELIDTEMALASGNLFFDDLAILVNNTGGTSASSATKIPGKCGTLGPLQCESGAVSGNELQAGKAIWYCDGINGGQKSTQCSMVTGLPPTNIISTNTTACNVPDIVIWNQTWAGCNATLGNGVEYSGASASEDLGIPTVAGKLYTWANQNSACPAGWKVPSRDDFKTLFSNLGCAAYNPGYETSVICPGLGWKGNGNTLAKALKIPLSGYRDTRFSQDYKFRGSLTYLATSSLYETDANYRRSILIDKNGDKLDEYASPKDTEYSVRCIKVGSTSTNTASPATNTNATTTNNTSTSTANTNTSPATNNTITNTTSTATNTNTTTSTSGNLKCTRNGIEYLNGDVRCDGANQVRCDGGTFKQIYSCAADSDRICTENPTRTTNGNFFTSCKYRTQTFYTNGGNGSITGSVPEAEVATLKVNASYKCTLDMNTLKYGNCVYQSCAMGSHEEAGKCEYDTRACELDNSPNGGRQIWTSARGWGICQSIEWSTTCSAGYRLVDGKCVTGPATCNQPVVGVSGKAVNLVGADGVEYSNKSYLGYAGGGNWQYDTSLSDACTYKCAEWFVRTSEIAGYRGDSICEIKTPKVQLTASKTVANPGDTITLTWNATDMVRDTPNLPQFKDGCYFITNGSASSGPLTTWTQGIGFDLRPASGSIDIKITEEMTFQMNCRASIRNVGSRSEVVKITLTPPPTVLLSINRGGGTGGDFYDINWGSNGALTCVASGAGAEILGWKTNGKTWEYYSTDRMYGTASAINSVPGKTFTLTCTGIGGTTVASAEFSKNSESGSCINGTYYAGSSYAWPDAQNFGTWLLAEYQKNGLKSVNKDIYLAQFQLYKDAILSGKTDSQTKSEMAVKIKTDLSGNWNYCD